MLLHKYVQKIDQSCQGWKCRNHENNILSRIVNLRPYGWGSPYVSSWLQTLGGHLAFPYGRFHDPAASGTDSLRCVQRYSGRTEKAKLTLLRQPWITGDQFQKVFLWRVYFQNKIYLSVVCSENTVYSLPLDTDIQVGDCSETRGHAQAPTSGSFQPVFILLVAENGSNKSQRKTFLTKLWASHTTILRNSTPQTFSKPDLSSWQWPTTLPWPLTPPIQFNPWIKATHFPEGLCNMLT